SEDSLVTEIIGDENEIRDEQRLEEYFIDPTTPLDSFSQTGLIEEIEPADQSQPQKFPVETVWVLKKSKRIEEQTIYYIDHPEMGIMLTIKPFTPVLLNPPEQAAEPLEEELAQDIIPLPQS
ncbi:MAG: hypothetical protein ACKVKX_07725, partial [Pseudomonadales bacterium]